MAANHFGNIFKITTWGESHGPAIGVVIDGCPAGLNLSVEIINSALAQRAPGKNKFTSPRNEKDCAQIYSGVFEGKTTGAPISIIIQNGDVDSSKYEPIKNLLRPGHANYTYMEKYGCFDYRGGGRASARETACRVAAGAVAQQLLNHYNIQVVSYLDQVGEYRIKTHDFENKNLKQAIETSTIFCPDPDTEKNIMAAIEQVKISGDSLGGVVRLCATNLPVGLGDPVYEKLEANLARAMLSIPATKGFEIGEGFHAASMQGSIHNDAFTGSDTLTQTNHAGGTLGGISTGMPLICKVAFKPTSSIQKPQATRDYAGNSKTFELPTGSRHDPCVAIRAVPVVTAMCQLVLADALLMNRTVNIESFK